MPVLVMNRDVAAKLLAERKAAAASRWDEVWDGVTFIMPEADIEHDDLSVFFIFVFRTVFASAADHRVHGRVNHQRPGDRLDENFRVPDMSLFLPGNPAQDCRTHYRGGPDFALEIVSPDDRSRDKLGFYASVGTRAVLILDRDPWQFELHQFRRGRMRLRATAAVGDGQSLSSSLVPMTFELVRGRPRPNVKITHTETGQEWVG